MTTIDPVFAAARLTYVWTEASIEGKIIIFFLVVFSMLAWSVMATKALQIRRAKRLNLYFDAEFRSQRSFFSVFDRKIDVDGCPLFSVYRESCRDLVRMLRRGDDKSERKIISGKNIEHVQRTVERGVASECLKLESGLILLAIAVSGAPFLGLLGTVWGVMTVFGNVAVEGKADLAIMAPGLAAAMMTTVAGLLVAIPSMFGYNWLVHSLRVQTVELDNFAQELMSRIEVEFLLQNGEEGETSRPTPAKPETKVAKE